MLEISVFVLFLRRRSNPAMAFQAQKGIQKRYDSAMIL
jgi:hypothetical protein